MNWLISFFRWLFGPKKFEPLPAPTPATTQSPEPPKPGHRRIVAVTLDDLSDLDYIISDLQRFTVKPDVRVVFDENVAAKVYVEPLKRLRPHVRLIMGELLDSKYIKETKLDNYVRRAKDYRDTLGKPGLVDIWELGNEINGDQKDPKNWVGSDSWAKVSAVIPVFAGYTKSLTLYLQKDLELIPFADKIPMFERMAFKYVLVSYYGEDNEYWKPNWSMIFDELSFLFPDAWVGIGECGDNTGKQKSISVFDEYYFGLYVDHQKFIGGFFWWYQEQVFGPRAFLNERLNLALTGRKP